MLAACAANSPQQSVTTQPPVSLTAETTSPSDYLSQVGFAEFNNTADNRANIGGTIIGAPIVGQ